jgi:hypothetical protein
MRPEGTWEAGICPSILLRLLRTGHVDRLTTPYGCFTCRVIAGATWMDRVSTFSPNSRRPCLPLLVVTAHPSRCPLGRLQFAYGIFGGLSYSSSPKKIAECQDRLPHGRLQQRVAGVGASPRRCERSVGLALKR